ncbi:hypothetical protein RJ640_007528 [Escallonia rubra]|uniref:Reverse transcriptase RNase H-like domain-containing protein n=1 Tax=Escallonia rubra TaxID=112253 RepID=A0AA88QMR4_9ASTE|nr:hypothetical protein RJ640_007528 [Escallonia rubra]
MNAFFDNIGKVQRGEQFGSQSRHPPTEEQTDTQDYEVEDAVGAFPQWCNAVTTQVGNPEESLTGEKPKDMPPKKKGDVPGKGLMYVDIKVNGKAIRAMVDTGATHNYISSTEVERLGLTLEKKVQMGEGYQLYRTASSRDSEICFDQDWPIRMRTNFSVVIMDNFKLIFGLEFLRDTKTTLMPCTNSLAMLGSKPCVIPTISPRAGERSISALQLKKGLKRDETTYLAMLQWDEIEEVSGPLPKEVKVILNDLEDVMPDELPKKFPPRRAINHEIELVPGTKPPARAPKLNEAKRRYTTHEKELLAVVHCLRVWRHYLLGSRFIVRTDNTAVSHFLSQSKLTSKQARWQELLVEFNFMLEYRACSTNNVADALSRRAELDQVAFMAMNAIVRANSRVAINIRNKIRKALTRDLIAQQLLKLIESGRRMKKHADKNSRSQEFNVGHKVMVKLQPQDHKFLRGRDSRLLQKYEGPLTIVKKIGKMAYKVDPPHWWSRQLHPVFHVSMLKPFYEDTTDPSRGQIRRPGLKPKAAGKRVAEAILNDRVITTSR